jgi:hypothetical protein
MACCELGVALPGRENIANSQRRYLDVRDVVNSGRPRGYEARTRAQPRQRLASVDRDDAVCPFPAIDR